MNSKPGTQRRRLFLVLTLVILHGSSGVSLAQPVADCAPRKPSLFAWWTGDGTALDLVGANHAILQNAVSFKSDAAITAQDTTYEGQDIIIEAATVTMDGIHSFRSLLLTNNGTLTHSPGSTPGLDLFVTGDVLIEANSSITGNGLGDGPDSGPAAGESKGGLIDRYGSGAGDGGLGGSTPHGRAGGPIYGSIASPVDFGSGGGSGGVGGGFDVSGGTGGGAVRLNVGGNLVLNGSLTANGTGGGSSGFSGNCGGGGSGGSIWLTARTLMGSGIVSADGGNGGGSKGGGGAGGRIALHATNFLYGGVISVNPGAGFQAGELGTYYAPPVVLPDPESFESGWGGWWQDGFIWNLRPPGNGPINAYTGTNALCGNTGGNYAPGSHGRLISPRFIVPSLSGDDRVVLRFWQSYQYGTGDAGLVQVSTQYETNWTTLFIAATNVPTSGWTLATADLTSYQGQELRLGFLHTADGDGSVGPGWFIDDVSLSHSTPMRLALNTPSAQRFTANPQGQYFVVSVPAGGHLRVTLDPAAAFGINEVYVRRGALPSPGAYDFRYQVNGGADQSIFAPNAGAGDWFILAYHDSGPVPSDYTLQADLMTGVILDHLAPASVGNSLPGFINLHGAGFTPSDTVELFDGASLVSTARVSFISASTLLAEFDFPSLPTNVYSLRVTSTANSDALPFEVTQGIGPRFQARLTVPSQVGRNNVASLYIEYENTGDAAMPAPLLVLSGSQNAKLTIKLESTVPDFWTSAQPRDANDTIQFLASGEVPGLLQPGERVRLPVHYMAGDAFRQSPTRWGGRPFSPTTGITWLPCVALTTPWFAMDTALDKASPANMP